MASRTIFRAVWVCAALSVVTLLAFSNSFHAGFALDNGFLLEEQRIHQATLHNVVLAFRHTYWWPNTESGLYRPFTTLSYLFNYAVLGNGSRPEAYHWINYILQAGNAMLAFFLALRLIGRDSGKDCLWPAAFAAGLWTVHPLLTESVTNIVGRADLLSGAAILSGLLFYLKSAETTGRARLPWLAALMAATTVGIFSKEVSVTIAGLIPLCELTWWKGRRRLAYVIDGWLAVLPPIGAFLCLRWLAHAQNVKFPFIDNPLVAGGFVEARLTAVGVMARYLGLLVWPARLSADYSWPQIPLATGTLRDWIGWTVVAGACASVLLVYRRSPAAFFFACFAFITFLPASNLLFPIGTIMAERLMYLPSLGLLSCLVLAVFWMGERIRVPAFAPLVLSLAMVALGARTWVRNRDWRDEVTIWSAAVEAAPLSVKTHAGLAQALFLADPGHANIDRVLGQIDYSLAKIRSLPDTESAWLIYRRAGEYRLARGDYRQAVELIQRAIAIQPAQAECYRALSTAWLRLNNKQAAIVALTEGQLVTGDDSLTGAILNLYLEGPDAQCAIRQTASGPVVNPSCESVHRNLCAAVPAALRTLRQAGLSNAAEELSDKAIFSFACPR